MPVDSTKVEIAASLETTEPIKRVLTVIDKKVRNLEKRKLKLDAYRQKQKSGECLEKDQQVAVDRYGEVVTNLEFAKDLQKQFQAINSDVNKLMKKQAKRGKSEKQLQEMKKIKELLQLQDLLDSLGSPSVRSDFQTGKHGAIVLPKENLEQIDELYNLISPVHDHYGQKEYLESLSVASDHIVNLLDAREKPVAGSTYKDLKELINFISGCGYFEKSNADKEGNNKEKADGEEGFEVVEVNKAPHHEPEAVQSVCPKELPKQQAERLVHTSLEASSHSTQSQGIAAQADSFFMVPVSPQAVHQQQQHVELSAPAFSRPIQEIVSFVQGNYNFLQESTIDLEEKREFLPHMDPAVVAAHGPCSCNPTHPMLKSKQSHMQVPNSHKMDTAKVQQGFGALSYSKQPLSRVDQQSGMISISSHPVSHAAVLDQKIYSSSTTVPSQIFASSGFGQSSQTHSLQTDNVFSGASCGHKVAKIGKGASDASIISPIYFDIPPQLPSRRGHDQTGQADSDKKAYPMDPSATEFEASLFSPDESDEGDPKKSFHDGFQAVTYSSYTQQQSREHSENIHGFRGGHGANRESRGGNMSNVYSGAKSGRGHRGVNRAGSSGPRGGASRGNSRQGFGRPNFNQPSQ